MRVPEDIKGEMAKYDINWSEFLREAIREKIVDLRRERAFREMDEMKSRITKSKISMAGQVIKWRKRQ